MQQRKTQQKLSGNSLTLTGKGEKDVTNVMNLAKRLILSTLGSERGVQKERERIRKRRREPFSVCLT